MRAVRRAIAAAALLAATASAPVATPVWQGVWAGRVGDLPVRACLARRGQDLSYAVGSYYYLSRLRPIKLEQLNGSRVWQEGQISSDGPARPAWTFSTVSARELAGVWSGGERRLPFRLARLGGAGSEEPCGSAAFNAPRLRPLKVATTRATKDGVGYTKLRFDPGPAFEDVTLETFALDGDGPAVRRVNVALRRPVAGDPARSDWFKCVAGALNAHGTDGYYGVTIEPTTITRRWLSASSGEGGYCGGAHPFSGDTSLTFDLSTGAAVDVEGWLNHVALERRRYPGEREDIVTVRPALRRAAMARAGEMEAECREATGAAEFWDIGLTRTGLKLTPSLPHVLTACENPVVLPWAALEPFLSPAGRAGAATLR